MPEETHLTGKEVEWYLEHKGVKCPKCHSDDIEGRETIVEAGEAHQGVSCHECGYRWEDVYQLVDVIGEDEL